MVIARPFSNPGKLIAVVWTLAGVIIIGILVGFIAVSLTGVTVWRGLQTLRSRGRLLL